MAVDMEYHVTCRITDGQARMGGGVVEDPEDLIIGILGALDCWAAIDPRAASMVGSTAMS